MSKKIRIKTKETTLKNLMDVEFEIEGTGRITIEANNIDNAKKMIYESVYDTVEDLDFKTAENINLNISIKNYEIL